MLPVGFPCTGALNFVERRQIRYERSRFIETVFYGKIMVYCAGIRCKDRVLLYCLRIKGWYEIERHKTFRKVGGILDRDGSDMLRHHMGDAGKQKRP